MFGEPPRVQCDARFMWETPPYGVAAVCELPPHDDDDGHHAGRVIAHSPAYTLDLAGHVVRWQT